MIITLNIIFILATVLFGFLTSRAPKPELYNSICKRDLLFVVSIICGIGTVIFFGVAIYLACSINTEYTLEQKIVMYQEENENIEKNINEIVKNYLNYERDTFSDLKPDDSSMNLVTLFPELKSNELVKQQMDIYIENNQKIKDLKEAKINILKKKWILYFSK